MANIDFEEGRRQGRDEVLRELLATLNELSANPATPLVARPYITLAGKWLREGDFQAPRREAVDTWIARLREAADTRIA